MKEIWLIHSSHIKRPSHNDVWCSHTHKHNRVLVFGPLQDLPAPTKLLLPYILALGEGQNKARLLQTVSLEVFHWKFLVARLPAFSFHACGQRWLFPYQECCEIAASLCKQLGYWGNLIYSLELPLNISFFRYKTVMV